MLNAPITFTHNGKTITGQLSQVMGGGSSSHFHLMVNQYYWGQLFYNQHQGGWVFYGKDESLSAMAEHFGWVVTAWLDSTH